jgi:aarF domain-containing kinase
MPEFRINLLRELNFMNEGRNSERAAADLKAQGNTKVYIPKVKWDMSSPRVLAMEFVQVLLLPSHIYLECGTEWYVLWGRQGVKINNIKGIKALPVNPKEVAGIVAQCFAEQVFVHGFCHCDPHPGNLLVRPLPRDHPDRLSITGRLSSMGRWLKRMWTDDVPEPAEVVLLDHGLYRELTPHFREHYGGMWRSMVLMDMDKLLYHCNQMGIGEFAEYMPLIFTQRPIDSQKILGESTTSEVSNDMFLRRTNSRAITLGT